MKLSTIIRYFNIKNFLQNTQIGQTWPFSVIINSYMFKVYVINFIDSGVLVESMKRIALKHAIFLFLCMIVIIKGSFLLILLLMIGASLLTHELYVVFGNKDNSLFYEVLYYAFIASIIFLPFIVVRFSERGAANALFIYCSIMIYEFVSNAASFYIKDKIWWESLGQKKTASGVMLGSIFVFVYQILICFFLNNSSLSIVRMAILCATICVSIPFSDAIHYLVYSKSYEEKQKQGLDYGVLQYIDISILPFSIVALVVLTNNIFL